MQKQKLQIALGTSLIWIISLSSCAGIQIKTWFLDSKTENALIRKNEDGSIQEKLTYLEAYGYRCYSPIDDEAWRTRLAECCAGVYAH
jgi:hypothetical protein